MSRNTNPDERSGVVPSDIATLEHYRTLVQSLDDGFALLEVLFGEDERPVDCRFLEVNPTFEKHAGVRDVTGRRVREVAPQVDEAWPRAFGEVALTGRSRRFTRYDPMMGRWFETFAMRVGPPADRRVAAVFKDIDADVGARAALRESERRHRSMADFRRSVMRLTEDVLGKASTDAFHGRILAEAVAVIPGAQAGSLLLRSGEDEFSFVAAQGYDLAELQSVRLSESAAGFGQTHVGLQPRIVRHPEPHATVSSVDHETLCGAGRHDEIQAVLIVPIIVDDRLTAFLTLDNFADADAFTDDAVEMARVFAGHVATLVKRFSMERALHRLAYHDPLTTLPNRAMFREHLERRLARARREGTALVVMFVDLDDLKPINDSLGHPAGDEVLRVVADRLAPLVGHDALVARVGGDEFTVVLAGADAAAAAVPLAERILAAIARPIRSGDHELHIGASIGIAVHPDHGDEGQDLLRHADIAMYHAKQRGKGDYAMFIPEMEAAPLQRLLLEEALRVALDRDQFVVHYQPRVDMASGRVVCVEALVRWQHPQRGLVPPGLFIPLAESTNLIHPLGRRILQGAVRQARLWREAGHAELRVAVNLSARQLAHPGFVDEIRAILDAEGLPPAALELEVLESVAIADRAGSAAKLAAVKALGVSVALDDFGMGYSSLSYLRDLPVDTIKIDRTFLSHLHDDDAAHDPLAIVRTITELGKGYGLTVVAEGVETRVQWDRLRRVGCHEAQGYLLARPMPAAELEAVLAKGSLAPS